MIQFASLQLALDSIRALPNYVPGSLASTYESTHDTTATDQVTCTKWTYRQELAATDQAFRAYKDRYAVISETLRLSDEVVTSVGLSYQVVSETFEGFNRVTNVPAGQQPVEYQLASFAFEMPTDADMAAYHAALSANPPTVPVLPRGCVGVSGTGAASDSNPIYSYHDYQIPGALTLGDIAAEWESLPRFTALETDTGFYLTVGDQSTFKRMGGFTLDGQGITLCGTNTMPAKMPPGGIYATVDLVPQVPIKMASGQPVVGTDGIPEVDYAVASGDYTNLFNGTAAIFPLFLRVKATRTRPCETDATGEIRPYVDIDWDLTRKK
jgi:hypothetical protein